MPYISKSEQRKVNEGSIKTAGQFNYALNQLIAQYFEQNKINYQTCNDIVGGMECAKMELYRRLIAPYEDKKILMNGDVKPYDNT